MATRHMVQSSLKVQEFQWSFLLFQDGVSSAYSFPPSLPLPGLQKFSLMHQGAKMFSTNTLSQDILHSVYEHLTLPMSWHSYSTHFLLNPFLYPSNSFILMTFQLSSPSFISDYQELKCILGFSSGSVVKRICLQCRRHGFNHPWVQKIPWRKKWQPTRVFLPGKSHGQRKLAGGSPWGHKRVKQDLAN